MQYGVFCKKTQSPPLVLLETLFRSALAFSIWAHPAATPKSTILCCSGVRRLAARLQREAPHPRPEEPQACQSLLRRQRGKPACQAALGGCPGVAGLCSTATLGWLQFAATRARGDRPTGQTGAVEDAGGTAPVLPVSIASKRQEQACLQQERTVSREARTASRLPETAAGILKYLNWHGTCGWSGCNGPETGWDPIDPEVAGFGFLGFVKEPGDEDW